MQKILIIISILILVGGIAWFVLYSRDDGVAAVTLDDLIKMAEEEGYVPDVLKKPAEEQKPDLEGMAFKIIARPILIRKSSLSEDNQKRVTEKINELTKAIKEDYDYFLYWVELGNYRKYIEDYEGAIEAWDFAGLLRPKNHISFHNLGELYGFYLGDYKKAEQNFLKSIINDSANIDAYMQLASLYEYRYTEKADQIENLFRTGLKFNPNEPHLMIALGNYYKDQGKIAKALEYFEKVAELYPDKDLEAEIEALKSDL